MPAFLALASTLVGAALLVLSLRFAARSRASLALGGIAVALAFVGHVTAGRATPAGDVQRRGLEPHLHEAFHYWLGAKYFDALGYDGLYEATIVADAEDDPGHFRGSAGFRDLRTYRVDGRRAAVLERADDVRARFEPGEWGRFKADLAVLRARYDPTYWHAVGCAFDHGYNGSPLMTVLLGGLARQSWLDAWTFLVVVSHLDKLLLVGVALIVARSLSPRAAFAFLFLVFANPLGAYRYVGGSYLRYLDLAALALGVVAWRRRWFGASGGAVALASAVRVFPGVLAGLAVVAWIAREVERRRGAPAFGPEAPSAGALRRFVGGLAAGTLLVVAVTPLDDWAAFASKLDVHSGAVGVNQIGLAVLASYDPGDGRRVDVPRGARELALREDAVREARRERRGPTTVLAVAIGVAALALARRGTLASLLVAWGLVLWSQTPLAGYYWVFLALLPLASDRLVLPLLIGLPALTLVDSPGLVWMDVDARFAAMSGGVGALLAWVAVREPIASRARRRRGTEQPRREQHHRGEQRAAHEEQVPGEVRV